MLAAATFWSFGSVLGKSTHASGVVLSFWRLWIASVVMLVIVARDQALAERAGLQRAALAGVLFGLNICAFFISLETVTIATALIIAALAPVVALPVSVLLFGERLTFLKSVCAAGSVIGVVVAVLVAPSSGSGASSTRAGYVWAVLALVFWVGYLLVSKGVRAKVETVRFMFVVSFIGAITLSVLVVVGGKHLGEIHGRGGRGSRCWRSGRASPGTGWWRGHSHGSTCRSPPC